MPRHSAIAPGLAVGLLGRVLLAEEARLVAHHQDDLVLDVEMEVVVVVKLLGGGAVAYEHDLALDAAAAREIDRDEVLLQFEFAGTPLALHSQAVVFAQAGTGGDFERLQVCAVLASRHHALRLESLSDVVRSLIQLGHARPAAPHLRGCQEFDMAHVSLDGLLVRGTLSRPADQQERGDGQPAYWRAQAGHAARPGNVGGLHGGFGHLCLLG